MKKIGIILLLLAVILAGCDEIKQRLGKFQSEVHLKEHKPDNKKENANLPLDSNLSSTNILFNQDSTIHSFAINYPKVVDNQIKIPFQEDSLFKFDFQKPNYSKNYWRNDFFQTDSLDLSFSPLPFSELTFEKEKNRRIYYENNND